MSKLLNQTYFFKISLECGTAASLFLFCRNETKSRRIWNLRSLYTTRVPPCAGRINLDSTTDTTADSTPEVTQAHGPYSILYGSCQANPEGNMEFWKEAERRKVGPEAT